MFTVNRALALIGGLALTAPALSPLSAGEDALDFGAKTYKQFCSHCHGLKMVNPGTSSYDLRKFPPDDKPRFVDSVMNGRGDMPAWGDILLPDEVDALWFYVATRAGKEPFPEDEAAAPQAPAGMVREGALTACLARNGGAMSSKRSHGGVGLDYELSAALAASFGLDLAVAWFESEPEEESTPAKEIYAMLAHGLCDIAPGFALYAPSLDRYATGRAALPRWDDKPKHIEGPVYVDLAPIAVSAPYARMEIGLVTRAGVDPGPVTGVADLAGQKIGAEQGTLPGIITLRQGGEAMAADVVTLNPGPKFLWEMEQGRFDVALVTVGAFDFHRRQNPITELVLADYRHPIGFNLGVAMAGDRPDLKAAVDAVVADLLAADAMAEMADKSGVHYAPPRAPDVQPRLTMRDIVALR